MDPYLLHTIDFLHQFTGNNCESAFSDKIIDGQKPDGIIIVGMGSSAHIGRLLQHLTIAKHLPPILVWDNYLLPKTPFRFPLYIFLSVTGGTHEVLSGLENLLTVRKIHSMFQIGILAGSGKLKDLAIAHKIPSIFFDVNGKMPREALGVMYKALILLLAHFFTIPTFQTPNVSPTEIAPFAKEIAEKIKNKITLIYTDREHAYLGYLWKTIMNETGKLLSFNHTFPELFHNEITSFVPRTIGTHILWIYGEQKITELETKIQKVQMILAKNGTGSTTVGLPGNTKDDQAWNSIVLSHLVGYYVAEMTGQNPTNIDIINNLKKGLL